MIFARLYILCGILAIGMAYPGDDDHGHSHQNEQGSQGQTEHAEVPDGVIKLEGMSKVSHPLKSSSNHARDEMWKRTGPGDVLDSLSNQRFYYSTDVKIGTPPQTVNLLLDTGSSDTWVFTPNTKLQHNAKPSSYFDQTKSRTFRSNGSSFAIQYGIGSSSGSWGHDVFQIGGAKLSSLSIGLADKAAVNQGIIGIGRPEAESTYKSGNVYENLPLRLHAEGIINVAAYSLYLDNLNSKSGTIIFGGVDTSKFIGTLKTFPVTHPKHLGITLQAVTNDGRAPDNVLSKPTTAVLDSGTTLSYFKDDVIGGLHGALNANPSFAIGQKYYCDCNVTNHLILDFGGAEISVPSYYWLWPIEQLVNPAVAAVAFPENSCYIGLETVQSDMDFILIGDNLLRAFYTVYDITNNKISIGQVNPNPGRANIQPITRNHMPGTL